MMETIEHSLWLRGVRDVKFTTCFPAWVPTKLADGIVYALHHIPIIVIKHFLEELVAGQWFLRATVLSRSLRRSSWSVASRSFPAVRRGCSSSKGASRNVRPAHEPCCIQVAALEPLFKAGPLRI